MGEAGPIGLSSVVCAAGNHVYSDVAGEGILLDLHAGIYHGLDAVAGYIWNMVQQPHSLEEIVAAVCSQYDVTPETCREDVRDFLADLQRHNLLEVRDAQAHAPAVAAG